MTDPFPTRRSSRFWLYGPVMLLALLVAGWSAFWFHARGRVAAEVDAALVREAERGRSWTCADRSIAGYPFRIELRCKALTLTSTRWGEAVRVETGPAVAVGQIYSPGLVIVELSAPAKVSLPEGRRLDLTWKNLDASLVWRTPERFALVAAEPRGVLSGPDLAPESWGAATLEAHLRRNPTRPASDQAVDIAVSAKGTMLPPMDALLGNTDAGEIDLQATLTQAESFRKGFNPDALESWRAGEGGLELTRLAATKGKARIDGSGRVGLDPQHRVAGELRLAAAGIEQIGGLRVGNLLGGLGGFLGGRGGDNGTTPGLTPLPPVSLREGRVFLGPIRLPLQPLAPLY
ncbi:DUF2125 domain-containing protein [Bosea sp. (in: a-proteobacteria)]|uniref:DUF2125 domain-containing protein n=1 Tax=Bosea sp. (in: a-proteobacteria) TaxID=1871050 RepID=UPI00261FF137|nr:DUF2125 domain-containing protein [Bosea sp. (in: a-proteobacteria)]MCO5090787.1 DUF2125 domain-containing protein [Bosea sp. (in: a-proteobacteria)]